ncbi:uncharacterized protein LOC130107501 [Lampris incognitus]|uniref:uncharacterized protein LOC130107501 n=1 Tax=Lampris incognitus TaxID=2546036 RepID=UPI0024B59FD3|nr:uncharacterized protein LOC130107501 [Lampris incognitus]
MLNKVGALSISSVAKALSIRANSGSVIRMAPSIFNRRLRLFSTETGRVRVLYDGLCPICVTEIRFLSYLQQNRPGKVEFIDISLPDYNGDEYGGVSYEMAMEAMHVIDEKDEIHCGVPAFAVMYSAVGLGWMGCFMMWPPLRPFMVKAYDIFARNRLKWTGSGDECVAGRCEKKSQ